MTALALPRVASTEGTLCVSGYPLSAWHQVGPKDELWGMTAQGARALYSAKLQGQDEGTACRYDVDLYLSWRSEGTLAGVRVWRSTKMLAGFAESSPFANRVVLKCHGGACIRPPHWAKSFTDGLHGQHVLTAAPAPAVPWDEVVKALGLADPSHPSGGLCVDGYSASAWEKLGDDQQDFGGPRLGASRLYAFPRERDARRDCKRFVELCLSWTKEGYIVGMVQRIYLFDGTAAEHVSLLCKEGACRVVRRW